VFVLKPSRDSLEAPMDLFAAAAAVAAAEEEVEAAAAAAGQPPQQQDGGREAGLLTQGSRGAAALGLAIPAHSPLELRDICWKLPSPPPPPHAERD
jgi:hypothetical protein